MVQFNEDAKTRSYLHFATLNEALESHKTKIIIIFFNRPNGII